MGEEVSTISGSAPAGPAARSGHDQVLEFTCPRCLQQVAETFYGPCSPCRESLRHSFAGTGRDVAAPAFEPKMNVTPNAVALKD